MDGVLFHYTTLESLYGIVESRTIRASHVYYLNDSNEIRTAADEAIRVLDANQDRENPDKVKSFMFELSKRLVHLRTLPHYIFVFSLSEHRNLLSQWRAYTRHGSGVSLGFLKEDLEHLVLSADMTLVKCIYDRADREVALLRLLTSTIDDYFARNPGIADETILTSAQLNDYFNSKTGEYLKCFCGIKDPTFKEEGEWRMVSKYFENYTNPAIKFRPGRTTLIPYIEIPLEGYRADGDLFEQVFPGPSPNFELSYHATACYLSNKRACKLIINPESPWTER